jgi:hypothetical protein
MKKVLSRSSRVEIQKIGNRILKELEDFIDSDVYAEKQREKICNFVNGLSENAIVEICISYGLLNPLDSYVLDNCKKELIDFFLNFK